MKKTGLLIPLQYYIYSILKENIKTAKENIKLYKRKKSQLTITKVEQQSPIMGFP